MLLSGFVRDLAYSNEGRTFTNSTGRVELDDFGEISLVSDGAGGGAAIMGITKWMVLAKNDKQETPIAL